MMIYKVFRALEWAQLERDGETAGAPVDVSDGYVHFSTRDQLAGTLARHFAGESGLMLLALDADTLGPELRWEPARDGALFPHLYRMLHRADIRAVMPLAGGAEGPILPGDLA
jgi:uncharacterized protein (DUF952 family)